MEVLENSIRQQRDALAHIKRRLQQEEEEAVTRRPAGARTLAAQATGHRLHVLGATLRGLLQQECLLVPEMPRERLETFVRASKKASANLRNSCLCLASHEAGAEKHGADRALESARHSLRTITRALAASAPPHDACCPCLARLLQDLREPFAE
ncbi:uncharacterized protein LOC144948860 [Lampetra fluviatilis]